MATDPTHHRIDNSRGTFRVRRSRFDRLTKRQRNTLRLVIDDGGSIGEILLLLLHHFSSVDLPAIGSVIGCTTSRCNELSRSLDRRIDRHLEEIERFTRVADLADSRKVSMRNTTCLRPKRYKKG